MVQIEINGVTLEVEQGSMIIEAADNAGIRIPRFCYHKKLSIAANCRMCLVEVAGGRKPLPACATPVTEGMKVFTQSEIAIEAQKSVMEFLLINHPLDCPICDQGGECELQDVSLGYGSDVSRYSEGKRVVKDKNLGPLIATDMTRCIHCTRCVRFGQEIAGLPELGAVGRGEHTTIGTYIERSVTSELSGNVIDVCPVGALTSKPFRFQARTWELQQAASIAPHDCVGSNLFLHSKQQQVMRVVPRENEAVNEVWISDRDRFSYEALNSNERALQPLIKKQGVWQEVDWQTALDVAVSGLKRTAAGAGVDKIAAAISPSATLEEQFLLSSFLRGFGCNNIDHRHMQTDIRDQQLQAVTPPLLSSIAAIEQMQQILLVGSNIRKEQPILAHRINKASRHGATVQVINPLQCDFVFAVTDEIISVGGQLDYDLAAVAKHLGVAEELAPLVAHVKVEAHHEKMADSLSKEAESRCILLGALAIHHDNAAVIRRLAYAIAEKTGASVVELGLGANATGAWLAGCVPHRAAAGSVLSQPGLSSHEMFAQQMSAYLLFDVEPELDCADGGAALKALQQAEWVVYCSPFVSETMKAVADVILPITPFAETSGTFVNIEGRWQEFQGAVQAKGNSRPGWKVLRVMGNMLELQDFDYNSTVDVRERLRAKLDSMPSIALKQYNEYPAVSKKEHELVLVTEKSLYAVDSLLRRAPSLQATEDARQAAVYINENMAARLSLQKGSTARVRQQEQELALPVCIDNRIADNTAMIPAALAETIAVGAPYSSLEITQA